MLHKRDAVSIHGMLIDQLLKESFRMILRATFTYWSPGSKNCITGCVQTHWQLSINEKTVIYVVNLRRSFTCWSPDSENCITGCVSQKAWPIGAAVPPAVASRDTRAADMAAATSATATALASSRAVLPRGARNALGGSAPGRVLPAPSRAACCNCCPARRICA